MLAASLLLLLSVMLGASGFIAPSHPYSCLFSESTLSELRDTVGPQLPNATFDDFQMNCLDGGGHSVVLAVKDGEVADLSQIAPSCEYANLVLSWRGVGDRGLR